VLEVMAYWCELGVDGFRLDAIPYLVEREGTANENLPDLSAREWAVMIPMAFLMFWIGLYPKPLLEKIEPSAQAWLAQVGRRVLRVEAPVLGPPGGLPLGRGPAPRGVAAAWMERLRGEGRP